MKWVIVPLIGALLGACTEVNPRERIATFWAGFIVLGICSFALWAAP